MRGVEGLERVALVPLRLAIGAGLFAHGFAKLAHGSSHFAKIVETLGFPAPITMSAIVIAIELATGVAIVLGAFVRAAALVAAPVIAVAIVGVHLRYGFLSVRLAELGPGGAKFGPVGYELGVVYLAALVALALAKPTPWSIDGWRTSWRTRRSLDVSAT